MDISVSHMKPQLGNPAVFEWEIPNTVYPLPDKMHSRYVMQLMRISLYEIKSSEKPSKSFKTERHT